MDRNIDRAGQNFEKGGRVTEISDRNLRLPGCVWWVRISRKCLISVRFLVKVLSSLFYDWFYGFITDHFILWFSVSRDCKPLVIIRSVDRASRQSLDLFELLLLSLT